MQLIFCPFSQFPDVAANFRDERRVIFGPKLNKLFLSAMINHPTFAQDDDDVMLLTPNPKMAAYDDDEDDDDAIDDTIDDDFDDEGGAEFDELGSGATSGYGEDDLAEIEDEFADDDLALDDDIDDDLDDDM